MMESESIKKATLSKLDKWSQIFMLIGLFATPIMFWPAFGMSLDAAKKVFLAGSIVVALILWFIARLKTKTLAIPKTGIWGIATIFGVATLVSSFVSGSAWSSILGLGIESGTVFSLAILFGLTFLATEYSLSKEKFAKIYIGIFSIFVIAFLFQALRYLLGNFTPWPVYDYGAANLIGKWNDLGILSGLVALSSVIMLELFPLKEAKGLKAFIWTSLVLSVLMAALVNFYQLWIVLAIFFLVVYVFNLTVLSHGKKGYMSLSAGLFVISLLFVLFANPLTYDAQGKAHEGVIAKQVRQLSEKLKISSLEVRPSWRGTAIVTKAAVKDNMLFGVGPNHFQSAWLKNKPNGVNDSQFWNIEPDFGVGFVPTFFVTTGMVGGLTLLAFVIFLLYVGFKALLNPKIDSLDKSFLLLSFVGAAYGWTLLAMYVPQTSIFVITFALTGLFIARLVDAGEIKMMVQPLATNAQTKFLSTFSSIGIGVLLLLVAYGWAASIGAILLVQRAGVAVSGNKVDHAMALMNRALVLNPQDIYYRTAAQVNMNQMGILLAKKLPQDQMMAEYSKIFAVAKGNVDSAVAANTSNYANYVARGSLYENIMSLGVKGAYDLAKKNYSDALEMNPFGPDMNLNLARLEVQNSNVQGAEKYLEQALKQKKDYIDAIFMQSQLYAQRGFLESAVTRLEYAAQLAPNDAGVLFQLGYMKYRNGDYRGAAQAMQGAVSLVPNYANALYFLGLSLDKLGQADKAIQAFQVVDQLNPGNAEVQKIISNLQAGRDALAGAEAAATKTAEPAKKKQ